jgi:hypothetical protein
MPPHRLVGSNVPLTVIDQYLLDRLVGAGKQDRWHIETIALAALTLFMPFSQSIMLTPFWVPPASAARALR